MANVFKTHTEKDGPSNSCVWALAGGKRGELWVGTWGGVLFRFAAGQFAQFGSRQGWPATLCEQSLLRAMVRCGLEQKVVLAT
jgi:ligand-binding sensor domain-containing protein